MTLEFLVRSRAEHANSIRRVALKRPGGFAMSDNIAKRAARLQYLRRQTVHFEVALIADDKPLRGIKQQQALRHVVDRGVQALFFHSMLLRQFANDEKQHRRYHEHEEAGHGDHKSGLFPPLTQRRRNRRGRDNDDWKICQGAGRDQPVLAVDRAGQARGVMVAGKKRLLTNEACLEIPSDRLVGLGVTRQQRTLAMVQGNRCILLKRRGREEFFEGGWRDGPGNDPEKLALRPGHLIGDDGCPGPREAAPYQFDQNRRGCSTRFEGLEIGPIIDSDSGTGQACDELISVPCSSNRLTPPKPESVPTFALSTSCHSRVANCPLKISDEFPADWICATMSLLNGGEIVELLVEVTSQQQHGVLQFAFAVGQRALAKNSGHDRRADRDCGDQEDAADDKPADRIAAKECADIQFEIEGGGTVCRHGSYRCCRCSTPEQFLMPRPYIATLPVWR